jgi:hypothetical protein
MTDDTERGEAVRQLTDLINAQRSAPGAGSASREFLEILVGVRAQQHLLLQLLVSKGVITFDEACELGNDRIKDVALREGLHALFSPVARFASLFLKFTRTHHPHKFPPQAAPLVDSDRLLSLLKHLAEMSFFTPDEITTTQVDSLIDLLGGWEFIEETYEGEGE